MRGRKVTTEQNTSFLRLLRGNGNVTGAADGVGLDRSTMYKRREADVDFAAAWDDAVAEACDRLEAEAWRRAVVGVEEPVIGRVGKDQDGIIKNADGENLVIKSTAIR